ncbi:MAG: VCBS repeat-containing protein [Planctomycetes bacterium]|nr:VCBS repeat-containing protein [Planctomycetota bacterium]
MRHPIRRISIYASIVSGLTWLITALLSGDPEAEMTPGMGGGSVNEANGSYSTAVSIEAPQYHGIEPRLSISYNSTQRLGYAGVGFDVGGLSMVERCSWRNGAPRWDGSDIYRLDGEELVSSTRLGGTHCTKVQSFRRIAFNSSANEWRVTEKDGTARVYTSVLTAPGGTFRWRLSRVEDTNGNAVTYTWVVRSDGGYADYLDRVTYNGNLVRLYWEGRSDVRSQPMGVAPVDTSEVGFRRVASRLKTVEVRANGAMARAYKLTYSTSGNAGASLLTNVQRYGSNATINSSGTFTAGTGAPAVRFDWRTRASRFNALTWHQDGVHPEMTLTGDVNGDTRTDLIKIDWSNQYQDRRLLVYKSTGGGFTVSHDSTVRDPVTNNERWFTGDFDGDGRTDLIKTSYDWRASVYLAARDFALSWNVSQSGGADHQLGDFDGDGKTDVVSIIQVSGRYRARMRLSTGTTFSEQTWGADLGATTSGYNWMAADFNGDGRTDLANWRVSGSGTLKRLLFYVHLSTGGDFRSTEKWIDRSNYHYWEMKLLTGDFNGDGCTDLSFHWQDGGRISVDVHLSSGRGFKLGRWISQASTWLGNQRVMPGDVNGDGLTDLVRTWDSGGTTYGEVFLARHDRTFTVQQWMQTRYPWVSPAFVLADFSGDGQDDLLQHWRNGSGQRQTVVHSAPSQGDLLYRVYDELGGRTTIDWGYSSIATTDDNNEYAGAVVPSVTHTEGGVAETTYRHGGSAFPVVAAVETYDGRSASGNVEYGYDRPVYHAWEHRFLGFASAWKSSDAYGSTTRTETTFHTSFASAGKPTRRIVKSGSSVYRDDSWTYAEALRGNAYESLLATEQQSQRNRSSLAFVTRRDMTYDTYGNVTVVQDQGATTISGDESRTENTYRYNTTAYIVGKLSTTRLRSGLASSGTSVAFTRFRYDNQSSYTNAPTRGNRTHVESWNDRLGQYATTVYGYDAYGNVTRQVDPVGNVVQTTSYDSSHVFPTRVVNAVGHVTQQTWDLRYGSLLTRTDPNGYAYAWGYDVLGRLTSARDPGKTITFDYYNAGNAGSQYVWTRRGSDADTKEYVDGLGRIYKTFREATVNGSSTWCLQEQRYQDATDRVWKRSLWTTSSSGSQWTEFAYDGLGRVTQVKAPDGTTKNTAYSIDSASQRWPIVTETFELQQQRRAYLDAKGREAKVREAAGTTSSPLYQTTQYGYDLLGNLTTIDDANSKRVSTMTYDSMSNRVAMTDSDLGAWTYAFDLAGRMTSQRNARGETRTMAYDAAGRITRRSYPNGSAVNWYYDQSGYGASLGHPTRVVYPGGESRHSWDWAGNETLSQRKVNGTWGSVSRDFDGYGRQSSVLVDGERVYYTYDGAGGLTSVYTTYGTIAGGIRWNAEGQMTQLSVAGNVTVSWNYDPRRLWLDNMSVVRGATNVFSSSYSYNSSGLLSIESFNDPYLGSQQRSHNYDRLNRLTSVAGHDAQSISYNKNGNIVSWSDSLRSRSYTYGTAHLHGVTRITDTVSGSSTNYAYTYDANGNTLSDNWLGSTRTFTWDYDDRLTRWTKGVEYGNYQYAADGTRTRAEERDGNTVTTVDYYFPELERRDGVWTKFYYAGPILLATSRGANGARAYSWFHSDRLGSVRAMTNAAGTSLGLQTYGAWGNAKNSNLIGQPQLDRGFAGHRDNKDQELVYMGARYYDTRARRFLSPDSRVTDPGNPQDLNRYAYARNNPVSNVDPTGHDPIFSGGLVNPPNMAGEEARWAALEVDQGATNNCGPASLAPALTMLGDAQLTAMGGPVARYNEMVRFADAEQANGTRLWVGGAMFPANHKKTIELWDQQNGRQDYAVSITNNATPDDLRNALRTPDAVTIVTFWDANAGGFHNETLVGYRDDGPGPDRFGLTNSWDNGAVGGNLGNTNSVTDNQVRWLDLNELFTAPPPLASLAQPGTSITTIRRLPPPRNAPH